MEGSFGGSCGNAFEALGGGNRPSVQAATSDEEAVADKDEALCRDRGADHLTQAWWVIFGGSYVALLLTALATRRTPDDDPAGMATGSDSPSAAFKAGQFVGARRARHADEGPTSDS
jgi:hypothetical protein